MNRFQYRQQPHNPPKLIGSACLFIIVLALFIQGISTLSDSSVKRQRESLENALTRGITYCYSIEGSYPESLEYLKKNYGIIYNEDLFFVDYKIAGSNMLPDITIIEKGAK